MILSHYELAQEPPENAFSLPRSRCLYLVKEPPAQVRLLVDMSGNQSFEAADDVAVLLFVRHLEKYAPPDVPAVMDQLPLNSVAALYDYTEVLRGPFASGPGSTLLQYNLNASFPYELRLEFYERSAGSELAAPLCSADFKLQDVLSSPGERLAVQLDDLAARAPGEPADVSVADLAARAPAPGKGVAAIGVWWQREVTERLVFEVRVRINKKVGWPFPTTRPFFLVYVKENELQLSHQPQLQQQEPQPDQPHQSQQDQTKHKPRWKAVYQSEVLSRVSDHPEADRSMYFQLADVSAGLARQGGNRAIPHDATLRIEVLQYKTTGASKLIAKIETTRRQLRQAALGEAMGLHVVAFPQAEMVGGLVLRDRFLTANTAFFSFQFDFGGDEVSEGDCLYLDVALEAERARMFGGKKDGSKLSKPCYTLQRLEDDNKWASVYRSEVARQRIVGRHEFRMNKMSLRRLNVGNPKRKLCLGVHQESLRQAFRQGSTEIGFVETTEEELRSMTLNSVLPIRDDDGVLKGVARLGQRETVKSRLLLSIVFEMGGGQEKLSQTPPSVPSVQVLDSDGEKVSEGGGRVNRISNGESNGTMNGSLRSAGS